MTISPQIIRLIDEIRNDRTHGASQLARQAITVLKTTAELSRAKTVEQLWQEQQVVGKQLMSARPAMAPLYNIVARFLNTITPATKGLDIKSARVFTLSTAETIIQESLQAVKRIAHIGSSLIRDNDRIMTHSYSSTVVAALKEAAAKYRNMAVIVGRSGPNRSGERMARELAAYDIPLTFIDDAAIGLFVSRAHKVMVGADRVCADGGVVNGIGTYLVALAAQRAGIPFYVLCETLKFDPRTKSTQVDLEEKEPEQVAATDALPGVKVKNPYFDITPLELITGIITENGMLSREDVLNYMRKNASLTRPK